MDIQEVIDLKKQLEEEFRKDTDAIDRVLQLLEKNKSSQQTTPDSQSKTVTDTAANNKQTEMIQPRARKFAFAEVEVGSNGNGNKNGNKFGRVRDSGVKGVGKQAYHYLPQDFERKDLILTIKTHFPEWSDKLSRDAINGAIDRLVEDGFIKLKMKGRGKYPAIFTKIKNI